jgi:hypothetical protein
MRQCKLTLHDRDLERMARNTRIDGLDRAEHERAAYRQRRAAIEVDPHVVVGERHPDRA